MPADLLLLTLQHLLKAKPQNDLEEDFQLGARGHSSSDCYRQIIHSSPLLFLVLFCDFRQAQLRLNTVHFSTLEKETKSQLAVMQSRQKRMESFQRAELREATNSVVLLLSRFPA